MSIKYFCDICSKELNRCFTSQRLKIAKGKVRAEVMVAIGSSFNYGNICKACLLDVLNTGEEYKD